MAENENTTAGGSGNLQIDARRVVAEVTVILESVAAGLESLRRLPESILITAQLDLLRGLVSRAVETVEAFGELLPPPEVGGAQ